MKARVKWSSRCRFVVETGSGHAVVIDGAPEAGGRNLGHAADGNGAGGRRRLHGVRRRLDPEARPGSPSPTAWSMPRPSARRSSRRCSRGSTSSTRSRAAASTRTRSSARSSCRRRSTARRRSCSRKTAEITYEVAIVDGDRCRRRPRLTRCYRCRAAGGSGSTCPSGRRRAPARARRTGRRAR